MIEPTWPDSPVTEVSALIVESVCGHKDAVARARVQTGRESFLITSYRHDFDYLWGFEASSGVTPRGWVAGTELDDQKIVLIIWDGMPHEDEHDGREVGAANYVTPFDWAVTFTYQIIAASGATGQTPVLQPDARLPRLLIFILDLESHKHAASFACRKLQIVKAALPWLQVYRPVSSSNIEELITAATLAGDELLDGVGDLQSALRAAAPLGSLGVQTLVEDLREPGRVLTLRDALQNPGRLEGLRELADLWRGGLTRAGDRHSVGNMLAPMLLAAGLPTDIRDAAQADIRDGCPARRALGELSVTLGLGTRDTAAPPVSSRGLVKSLRDEGDIFGRRKAINFLLVDDQYHLGYNHILAYLLWGRNYSKPPAPEDPARPWQFISQGNGKLRCEPGPDVLFAALESAGGLKGIGLPHVLDIPDCDILLLDLRLWSDGEGRRNVLSRLTRLCASSSTPSSGGKTNLSFDPALEKAYGHAERIVSGDTHCSEVEALALLPLLLSHCDPSLPIVIFSSTHQRKLVELLAHRRNIITCFSKPIPSEYGSSWRADEDLRSLHDALEMAVRFHEDRLLWLRLNQLKGWGRPLPTITVRDRVLHNAASAPADYSVGPTQEPRCDGELLRRTLAGYYVKYVQENAPFDFASLCWELTEASFVPDSVLISDKPSRFRLAPEFDRRGYVGSLSHRLRNKKAHGFFRASESSERDRIAMIISFMVFLDFVEGKQSKHSVEVREVEKLTAYLKNKYPQLFFVDSLSPQVLTHTPGVEDADLIAYAACYYADLAVDEGRRHTFFSRETVVAVRSFATYVMTRP